MLEAPVPERPPSPTGGERSVSTTIDRTDLHEVLSNQRRIELLELLREESPRDIGTLAEEIAATETGERPPPTNIRQSAYVTLHQTHLPKLDDLGIVTYDSREKVVHLDEVADVFFDDGEEDGPVVAGVEFLLGLSLVGLVTTLAGVAGVPILDSVSPTVYAVTTLVGLLVCFAYRLGRDGSPLVRRLREQQN